MITNLTLCYMFAISFWLYSATQRHQPGFRLWNAGILFFSTAFVFLVLRGIIPDWLSIFGGNLLFILSGVVRSDAICLFLEGRRIHRGFYWLVPVTMVAVMLSDQASIRNAYTTIALVITGLPMLRVLVRYAHGSVRAMYMAANVALVIRLIFLIYRAVDWILVPEHGLFQNSLIHSLHFTVGLVSEVAMNILFIFMNTERFESAQMQLYKDLQDSENRYRGLADAAFEGIIISTRGEIIDVNKGACAMFGRSAEEFQGLEPRDILSTSNDGDWFGAWKIDGCQDEGYSINRHMARHSSGEEFPVIVKCRSLWFRGKKTRIIAFQDLSEYERLSDEKQRLTAPMESILRLSASEFPSRETLLRSAMAAALGFTNASNLYMHFYDEVTQTIGYHLWYSGGIFMEPSEYKGISLSDSGIWTDAIRNRKPVIQNHPVHIPGPDTSEDSRAALRHMMVPVFDGSRLVACVGSINSPEEYDEIDSTRLSVYMNHVWHLYKRMRGEEELQQALEELAHAHRMLAEQNESLKELSFSDSLTGLANRRAIEQVITREMNRCNRVGYPLSLLIIDLDNFKSINDRYGHNAGDIVLHRIAEELTGMIRNTDSVCRWGGEEFLILALDTALDYGVELAEKIRVSLANLSIPGIGQITASIGVAQYVEGEEFNRWFSRADKALYRAKAEGRNMVYSYKIER